jgi:hypothetical protein
MAGAPPSEAAAAAICLWSGPRCCSTALMYSFAQRSDCDAADEPLYAAWARLTGAERPYLAQLLAAQGPGDAGAVFADVALAPRAAPLRLIKNMAKHRVGVSPALMRAPGLRHVLLVRDPARVIASFARVLPPTLGELGYSGARVCALPPPPPLLERRRPRTAAAARATPPERRRRLRRKDALNFAADSMPRCRQQPTSLYPSIARPALLPPPPPPPQRCWRFSASCAARPAAFHRSSSSRTMSWRGQKRRCARCAPPWE